MTYSMTGFARISHQGDWGQLTWELRCINHRYLDLVIKLPDSFKGLEGALRDAVRQDLHRGRLEATLHWCPSQTSDSGIQLNEALVMGLFKAYEVVAKKTGSSALINPMDILHWPEVVIRSAASCDTMYPEVQNSFAQALAALNAVRAHEGDALANIMLDKLKRLLDLVEQVRAVLPQVMVLQREKLVARLEAVVQEVDENRLEQELVYFAQKMDVSEEVDRLALHAQEFTKLLNQKNTGAIGRRLDFLAQELNREANTLSAKNTHPEVGACVLEMKILIDQLREQIQNVE
ncbi:MAG: YicC/YloC family endoribonuclease [Pseudomonadota bacterium]